MTATKAEVMKDEGVKIKLGGNTFEVKFTLNALCDLEEEFGNLTDAFGSLDMSDVRKIRKLLHIALANGENATITEVEVGALITMDKIEYVVTALYKAFGKSMPSTDEKGK